MFDVDGVPFTLGELDAMRVGDRLREAVEELRIDFEHDRAHLRKHTKAAYEAARRLLEAEENEAAIVERVRSKLADIENVTVHGSLCSACVAVAVRLTIRELLVDPQEGEG